MYSGPGRMEILSLYNHYVLMNKSTCPNCHALLSWNKGPVTCSSCGKVIEDDTPLDRPTPRKLNAKNVVERLEDISNQLRHVESRLAELNPSVSSTFSDPTKYV